MLIGICFIVRENQLPGLLMIFLVLLYKYKNKKLVLTTSFIFSIFLSMPFIHNYIYGGMFVLNQDVLISGYYYLSPSDILFNFSNIKDQLAFQLNFLVSNTLYILI